MPSFSKRLLVVVGGYGSGKSEVSVNLARYLADSQSEPVAIADLDIVNPYFRSREAAEQLAALGVRSIVPPGEQAHADLPIIIPEIHSAIKRHEGYLILDVGGDDVGSRVLSSLADAFTPDDYEMLLVLNANRPFTATVEGAQKMIADIEGASRLTFTGLAGNTHLMEYTTADTVLDGLALTRRVSEATGLPIVFVSALRPILEDMTSRIRDLAVLPLDRSLVKPWEKRA
ncbi:cobalamin biosynthesis protein CbiA [candidate division GN15 bacterium]|nr:cobalamin biosynthesis protein CbiA [candidate division GN15 bacterium]